MRNKNWRGEWIRLLISPFIGIVTFIVGIFFSKPTYLNLDKEQQIMAPLGFAMLITFISNSITSYLEKKKYEQEISNILETVKKYNHVITLGSPAKAMEYVLQRIDLLECVWNTSVNSTEEEKLSEFALYNAENSKYNSVYNSILKKVYSSNIIWIDICNKVSEKRLKQFTTNIDAEDKSSQQYSTFYQRKLIDNNQAQMNFMILRYKDQNKKTEVLFNWEHNIYGDPPKVLLSEDNDIVEMYKSHFINLLNSISE
jgi:hypothetical protein